MNFFKHRHVVVASIMAPLLALMAWYAVGHFLAEEPFPAEEGASYALVEMPGCRYAGGECVLQNGDFELALSLAPGGASGPVLLVVSAFPLEGIRVGVAPGGESGATEGTEPVAMQAMGPDAREWRAALGNLRTGEDRLRLVAAAGGALYFGEIATRFAVPKQ